MEILLKKICPPLPQKVFEIGPVTRQYCTVIAQIFEMV
jgi:hypothetical protein